ncbi:MAG: hypothetical protein E7028_04585 [Planctomycetaceae bacterium]|nr:hypothetical protein [Planctomycetaceae bacterium]MBQ2822850.1 hypothetical protein [Thermoguttaceae bacterium]
MAIWSFLFGGNKETPKRTFSDVSLDELNRERIGCQQEINKVERQQEALLKNENQLKNEYANATTEFQRKSIARKIQDGRMEQKQVEVWLTRLNQNIRIVNNFILTKKNQEFFERAGVLSLINTMDMEDFQKYIDDATVNGQLNNEKLVNILQAQDDALSSLLPESSDDGLADLMAELDNEVAPMRNEIMGEKADAGLADLESKLQKKAENGIQSVNRQLMGEK